MADETNIITGPSVVPGLQVGPLPQITLPTIDQLAQAAQSTPDQVQKEATDLISDSLDALVSGKSPLSSKTIIFNGCLFLAGVVGAIFTTWHSGNAQAIVPFLVTMATAAINTGLRFVTTGPLITNEMAKIMSAYTTAKTVQK